MRLKLISCEVLYRELCYMVSRSANMVDIEFLPKGLHDIGSAPMCERLQAVVDRVDETKYDAIVLGYALCNNGVVGLTARTIPIIIPRAHDCITLFMGSRSRYNTYFYANPGVYFMTTGWMERGQSAGEYSQLSIQRQTGMDSTYDELVAKYGEDNAKYLYDMLCQTMRNYGQYTFIEMGIEPDDSIKRKTMDDAAQKGWKYDCIQGDLSIIMKLVDGPWEDCDYLTVPPGRKIAATYEEGIIGLAP